MDSSEVLLHPPRNTEQLVKVSCWRGIYYISSSIWWRYAHGTRVLLSTGNESRNVTILDFNVNESTHSIRDSDSNWTNIYPQLRYSSALTPTMWKLSLQTACTSFMIDEGFVLGLQVREKPFRIYIDHLISLPDNRKFWRNDPESRGFFHVSNPKRYIIYIKLFQVSHRVAVSLPNKWYQLTIILAEYKIFSIPRVFSESHTAWDVNFDHHQSSQS